MSVSISCSGCSAPVLVGATQCQACGRALGREERDALLSRFEASNTDYRDAKTAVERGFAVALAVGAITVVFGAFKLVAGGGLEPDDSAMAGITFVGVLQVFLGTLFVLSFFVRHRTPAVLVVALTIWFAAEVFLIVTSPAQWLLGFISPSGVALTLGKLAAAFLILQAVLATRTMRRMVRTETRA